MKDTKDTLEEHGQRRRDFVTKSAKAAAVAPAVALLLTQMSTPAHAAISGPVVGPDTEDGSVPPI